MARRARVAAVSTGDARLVDAPISTATIPEEAGLRRRPRAAARRRPPGFLASFESRVLFYDAFWHADGQRILLVGPPPLNLQWEYRTAKFTSLPLDYWLGSRFHASTSVMLTELYDVPRDTTEIVASLGESEYVLPIRRNLSREFDGSNALVALCTGGDADAIADWAGYHVRTQGADAAILFLAGSAAHSAPEAEAALLGVAGLRRVAVVSWPFQMGTPDPAVFYHPAYPLFAQTAAMSVALRRFAAQAKGLLACGVDERVDTRQGPGVFEQLDASWGGLLDIRGRDPSGAPLPERRWALQPTRPWVQSLRVHPYLHRIKGRPAFSRTVAAGTSWSRLPAVAARADTAGQGTASP